MLISHLICFYFHHEDCILPHFMLFPSLPALLLKKTEKLQSTQSETLGVDNKLHSKTQITPQAEKPGLSIYRAVSPTFSQHIDFFFLFSEKLLSSLLHTSSHPDSCLSPFSDEKVAVCSVTSLNQSIFLPPTDCGCYLFQVMTQESVLMGAITWSFFN